MLKNYINATLRNLNRYRAFTTINILGLAFGLATCLLIATYVIDELSFDRFHHKADRIVRVIFKGQVPGGEIKEANVMPPTAKVIKADFPEIEETTRLVQAGRPFFVIDGKKFNTENMAFVDPNFFDVFTFPIVAGILDSDFQNPNTIILTESVANKYFGTTQVIGRELLIKDIDKPFKIVAIAKDLPHNSHIQFDVFASMASYPQEKSDSWLESGFFTYAVLKEGASYRSVEAKLPALFEKYAGPQFPAAFGMSFTAYQKTGKLALHLQKLTDIHLNSDFNIDLSAPGDIRYIYIFSAIGVFMLLIASINFMNLSTASASRRAKEVGIRKVLGSGRRELTFQFLVESLLLTLLALILALILAFLALPAFNELSGKNLQLHFFADWWTIPVLITTWLTVGLLAGSYPAFFLSAFKPVSVLKGKLIPENRGLGLRSSLVVFQFLISIGLIICTTVLYKQLDYIQHKKLGYDKDQVIVLQTWPLGKNEEVFKEKLLQDSRIVHVTNSPYVPAGDSYSNNFFVHPKDNPDQWVKALRYDIDDQYIPTLGITISAGRNFSTDYGLDSLSAIINETAARAFGWEGNALGKTLVNSQKKQLTVVGIVKDFHFKSLHERISPLVMVMNSNFGNLIIKTSKGDADDLLRYAKPTYDSLNPELPFSSTFLDDRINNTYEVERKTGYILGLFTGLTIFVACLGLFGLATFAANQRTKEIGIRKVLGASEMKLVQMLVQDFIKLILLALVIASPIAWWLMNRWLADFAYRIEIKWWMFALAGLSAVLIAILTVSWQAIRAAMMNPVKSLREE